MRRPRILHLRASNFVGGPEQQLLRYAQRERHSDFELTLGSFVGSAEGIDFLRAVQESGLRALSLPANSLASSYRALAKLLQERQFDLVCAHGYKADILSLAAGRSTGTPVACFLRGWTGENRKVRLYEGADRFVLRFADRVVCLSGLQAVKLSKRASLEKKIRVVTNAIDVPAVDDGSRIRARSELRRRLHLPQNCQVVATGGRLSQEKGLGDFLQAVSLIALQSGDSRFVIFGEGVERCDLESSALALGIKRLVVFAGFHRDLRNLLPGVDLLVNPSLSEEMPNIVLEAMAAAVPVLATRVGGLGEIAGTYGAVGLVPPGQPAILAQEMVRLLGDSALAKDLGCSGQRRVVEAYSLERQCSQFHALYKELLAWPATRTVSLPVEIQTANACSSEALPFLSIVMPVRNEERHIGRVLSQLESQDYPHDRYEILVADGNSSDGTAKAVEAFGRSSSISVRLLENPAQLSSAGRNVGARNSSGEFVIYLDGHCDIPNVSMLRDAVDLFTTTGADCLCRPQPLHMSGNTNFQNVVANVRATALGHGVDSTIYTEDWEGPVNPSSSGACYRRSVFGRIGDYDESFDACEDVEFNFRVFQAGLSSYFSPRLKVLYQPRPTLRSLWRQMTRYGRGRYHLVRKHPRAFSFAQLLPALFLIWFAFSAAGAFYSSRVSLIFIGTVLTYLVVVLGFTVRLAIRYGRRYLLQAPAVYALIHVGLGTGFLAALVSELFGRRRSGNNYVNRVSANSQPAATAMQNTGSNDKGSAPKISQLAECQIDEATVPRTYRG